MGNGSPEPGGVKFFFDRSVGKAFPDALRRVGVEIIIHDEIFSANETVPDEEWIGYACEQHLVIVHCDKDIRRNPAEKAAIVRGEARVFLLGGNANRFELLRQFMTAWPKIVEVIETRRPPYVYFIDENGKLHERAL